MTYPLPSENGVNWSHWVVLGRGALLRLIVNSKGWIHFSRDFSLVTAIIIEQYS